jgi:hypothetical protein
VFNRAVSSIIKLAVLGLLWTGLAAAQTYPVQLTRPWREADRYRISATGYPSKKIVATADGKVVDEESDRFDFEFEADGRVLAVRSDGGLAKQSVVVNNCLVRRDGVTRQLLPVGTVVIAAIGDGDKVLRINGEKVDKKTEDVLTLVISVDSGVSDDAIFGTDRERAVGDSWSINSASAVKALREQVKMQASQDDTRGNVRIEKRVTVGREDCLVIGATLDFNQIRPDTDILNGGRRCSRKAS